MARLHESRKQSLFLVLLGIAQVAVAVGIIAVISRELWHVTAYRNGTFSYNYVYGQCFLQSSYSQTSNNLCRYVYGTAGVGAVAGVVVIILQFVSCGRYGVNGCALLLSAVFSAWWAVTGGVVTAAAHRADHANIAQEKYRHIVVGLIWGELLLFTLAFLIDFYLYCTHKPPIPQGQIPMGTYTTTYPQPPPSNYPAYPPPGTYPYPPPQVQGYPIPQHYADVPAQKSEV